MPLQSGISSFAFGWAARTPAFDERTLLDFARAHDVPAIQFGDNVPLHALPPGRLELLADAARANGIAIETGARRMTAEHLNRYIMISRTLGARLLRFVVDADDFEPPPEEVVAITTAALPSLESAGVVLGLENHDRFSCAILRGIVDAIGSVHVGVCLDTANSLGAGEGIAEVLARLAPVCVNVHVKDFAIERLPYKMGFTVSGRSLGRGMLPLEETLAAVARSGRFATAVIELWTPPEPDMSATIAKEVRWAEESVVTLRAALGRLDRVATVSTAPAGRLSSAE